MLTAENKMMNDGQENKMMNEREKMLMVEIPVNLSPFNNYYFLNNILCFMV